MSKNTIYLEGRAVKDGETRGKVGKVRIAVQSWRKDPNAPPDSKFPNLTNFFAVVGFGTHAEAVAAIRKGQIVEVEGSCEISEWYAQDGSKRVDVEVHLGGKAGYVNAYDWANRPQTGSYGPGHGPDQRGGSARAPASGGRGPLPRGPAASSSPNDVTSGGDAEGESFFDDDTVPF